MTHVSRTFFSTRGCLPAPTPPRTAPEQMATLPRRRERTGSLAAAEQRAAQCASFSPRPGVPQVCLELGDHPLRRGRGGKASAQGGHSSEPLRAAGSVRAPGRFHAASCHGHVLGPCVPSSTWLSTRLGCRAPHTSLSLTPTRPRKPPIPDPPLDTCFLPDSAFQSLH